jgi:hypothetical protein
MNRSHRFIQHPEAEIEQMRSVMPEQIVRPTAPITGRSNILQTVNEKASTDVADLLLARQHTFTQSDHLGSNSQGMHHA